MAGESEVRNFDEDLDWLAEMMEKAWPPGSQLPQGPRGRVVASLPELIAVAKAAKAEECICDEPVRVDMYISGKTYEPCGTCLACHRAQSLDALDAKLAEVRRGR